MQNFLKHPECPKYLSLYIACSALSTTSTGGATKQKTLVHAISTSAKRRFFLRDAASVRCVRATAVQTRCVHHGSRALFLFLLQWVVWYIWRLRRRCRGHGGKAFSLATQSIQCGR